MGNISVTLVYEVLMAGLRTAFVLATLFQQHGHLNIREKSSQLILLYKASS